MFEENVDYIKNKVGGVLGDFGLSYYRIRTERIPLKTETHESIISGSKGGKNLKIITTMGVVPLSSTVLDVVLRGNISSERINKKFVFLI